MRSLLALLPLFLAGNLAAQYAGIQFSDQSFDELLATAKAEDKLVFVDAYAVWCGPCKMMTAKVFPQERVGRVFNERFVNAKIDMEKGEGPELARRYSVMAYPTYLFLNGDGELVHKAMGYIPADQLLAVAEDATGDNSLGAMNARYDGGDRGTEFIQEYMTTLSQLGEKRRSGEVMDDYLKNHEDWSDARTMSLIVSSPGHVGGDRMKYLLTHADEAIAAVGSHRFMETLQRTLLTYYINQSQLRTLPPTTEIAPFYTEYAAPLKDRLVAHYTMFQADQMRDTPTYLSAAKRYLAAYPSDDHVELNMAAWNFYERAESEEDLRLALSWAQKAVDMEATYPNLDTLAWLYDKLGMGRKAKQAARRAIEVAKATEQDFSETQPILNK